MFSKQVFVAGNFIEFYFHAIRVNCTTRYHVVALTPDQSIHFEMHFKHGTWTILDAPQPPKWIRKLEDELSGLIMEFVVGTTLEQIDSLPQNQNVLVQPQIKIRLA